MNGRQAIRLSIALEQVRHQNALLDGSVTVPGIELDPAPPIPDHADRFRRMCRSLEFDICELSLMSYYIARERGLPITAIPVVPLHQFRHSDFVKNVNKGIESPADLIGKRVGTRSYTVTPGVLDRGILSHEFGIDISKITWVLAEQEHVAETRPYPANVIPGTGQKIFDRLAAGEIDAGIAGSRKAGDQSPKVEPLFPNAAELDHAQYERTGIVPVFTVIVIKSVLLSQYPWLAEALYGAFQTARKSGLEPNPRVASIVDGDPVPIGLAANRASFDELLMLGREQNILTTATTVDDLFLPFD